MKNRAKPANPNPEGMRAECESYRDALRELARIHSKIDAPHRIMGEGEPEWIGRLRKICLHAVAITEWEIEADVEHVMAPELRAAYEQMALVWQSLPAEYRMTDLDGEWWAREARSGMLAKYDHPTGMSLTHTAGWGGFGDRNFKSDVELACWLGSLGLGYGQALLYLAQVLKVSDDVELEISRVVAGAGAR